MGEYCQPLTSPLNAPQPYCRGRLRSDIRLAMASQEEHFAEEMTRLRRVKRLSQTQLATEAGVSRRAIQGFEAATYQPKTRVWLRLREILGDKLPVP